MRCSVDWRGRRNEPIAGTWSASPANLHHRLCGPILGMLQVVAAILEREGRVLICRRKPEQWHPLQWEFPGGKVEPDESPEQALARELEEELDIGQSAGEEIARYEYCYP